MEIQLLQREAIGEAIGEVIIANRVANPIQEGSRSLGWPFGLATCSSAIHTPSSPALAFHQQCMNLQTTFLLPFFFSDDGDDHSSSSGDSDYARSDAASSFFKDSRRITLGSLIALPMDASFHAITGAIPPDARAYHVGRTRALNLPSCGILELLRRVRHTESSSLHEFDVELDPDGAVIANSGSSLAAYLQLEANHPCVRIPTFEDAVSSGSHSPDWNDQFVSCHSVLSNGEWTGRARLPTPKPSIPKPQKPQKMQRSTSMKSFFSSICCRIDAVKRP